MLERNKNKTKWAGFTMLYTRLWVQIENVYLRVFLSSLSSRSLISSLYQYHSISLSLTSISLSLSLSLYLALFLSLDFSADQTFKMDFSL